MRHKNIIVCDTIACQLLCTPIPLHPRFTPIVCDTIKATLDMVLGVFPGVKPPGMDFQSWFYRVPGGPYRTNSGNSYENPVHLCYNVAMERVTSPISKMLEQELYRLYEESGLKSRLQAALENLAHGLPHELPSPNGPTGGSSAPPESDHYRVLGVEPGDSIQMVRAVYRAKVLILHPDRVTGELEAFKRLQMAYEAVMKEKKRAGNGDTR